MNVLQIVVVHKKIYEALKIEEWMERRNVYLFVHVKYEVKTVVQSRNSQLIDHLLKQKMWWPLWYLFPGFLLQMILF